MRHINPGIDNERQRWGHIKDISSVVLYINKEKDERIGTQGDITFKVLLSLVQIEQESRINLKIVDTLVEDHSKTIHKRYIYLY